jgi:hypothetical protein
MFRVAIGHSEDPYTEDAADEIIKACRDSLGETQPQACMLFSAVEYDFPVILHKIREAFPNTEIVGCTSSGEISSQLGYAEGSVLLVAFASDTISMAATVARNISKDIDASLDKAVEEVSTKLKDKPVLCFTFTDIFTIGTVEVIEGLKKRLSSTLPILGGGASDPWVFDKNREFFGEEVLSDSAPMLFFSGPLEMTFNIGSGWEPFTSQKPIVESDKNTIYKIGDDSALEFYKHYLGGAPTLAHPLAVFEKGENRFYLRVALQSDEKTGSVVLGGDLPDQATTSICRADPQDLLNETQNIIQQTKQQFENKKPNCVFIISCACRQKILGTKTKEEYRILHEEMPEVPIFGFYAYGQVCPFNQEAPSFVHNESIVTFFLKERT